MRRTDFNSRFRYSRIRKSSTRIQLARLALINEDLHSTAVCDGQVRSAFTTSQSAVGGTEQSGWRMADTEHADFVRADSPARTSASCQAWRRCVEVLVLQGNAALQRAVPERVAAAGSSQCLAPNWSVRVARRTSNRNAVKAAVRHIIASTNRMAMRADKLMSTKALVNRDITTSETSSADIVQSVIAMFM